jgi:hypothetical protein
LLLLLLPGAAGDLGDLVQSVSKSTGVENGGVKEPGLKIEESPIPKKPVSKSIDDSSRVDCGVLREEAGDPEGIVRMGERDDCWADRARKEFGMEEDGVPRDAAPRGLASSTPPPGWGRAVVGGVLVFSESQPKFPPWGMGIVMRKVRVAPPGDAPEAKDDEGGGPNMKCEGGGSIFDGSAWLLTAEAPRCQGTICTGE